MPRNTILTIATTLALIAGGAVAQTEQEAAPAPGPMMGGADMPMMQHDRGGSMMKGHPMMTRRDQGRGGMGPHMMLMMMALVDTDASGTLSLEEVQAVHARMFQYADTDDDGELTLEELRAFMHGGDMPAAQ